MCRHISELSEPFSCRTGCLNEKEAGFYLIPLFPCLPEGIERKHKSPMPFEEKNDVLVCYPPIAYNFSYMTSVIAKKPASCIWHSYKLVTVLK
jgi:hypothetical protein